MKTEQPIKAGFLWFGAALVGAVVAAFMIVPDLRSAPQGSPSPAISILATRCLSCHGEAKMAGLDLRSRDAVLRGGTRGAAIVPGHPEKSLLVELVNGQGKLRMPMGGDPLPDTEIAALTEWIRGGAEWDAAGVSNQQQTWWSFRPPVKPAVPEVAERTWRENPIDSFVFAKLGEKGLKPSAWADKRTLIRRAYFDLLGLPPSAEEVEKFVNDSSPEAYANLVERLLQSPRYGERWGRHWLDVVRYADTGGFETDIYFPNAWRYRDYVIKSFNDDKPYDRFVQEQIAGDELWPDDLELDGGYDIPEQKLKHLEARIGTGVYTIGPVYHEAALNGEQLRYEWRSDAADTTGAAFLGLTVGCARCHDHKFDPITQRDYHALMAFFAGSAIRETPATNMMSVLGFYSGYTKIRQVEEYQDAVKRVDAAARKRVVDAVEAKFPPEFLEAYRVPREKRTAEQQRLAERLEAAMTEAGLKENPTGRTPELPYTPNEKDERERLIHELGKSALEARFSYPTATVLGRPDVVYPVRMTSRGDFHAAGEEVAPAFPSALSGRGPLEMPRGDRSIPAWRAELAKWLTQPDHPLTARVMVNRIWQGHFGRGIVATANDFGRQGEPPTHPELLDWLTVKFVEEGWSVKAMHRLIMTSKTYQLGSGFDEGNAKIDPDNRFLWRMNRRRLEAETLRDSVLATSGAINLKMGGEPVIPKLSEEERLGMWADAQWPETLDTAENNRRSVYLYVKRSFPFPMFTTFDMPDTSVSCSRRDVTTVAPQALELLNSEFMLGQAETMAAKVRESAGREAEAFIAEAWQVALGRKPGVEEQRKALELFDAAGVSGAAAGKPEPGGVESASPETRLCLLLLNMNEYLYVD